MNEEWLQSMIDNMQREMETLEEIKSLLGTVKAVGITPDSYAFMLSLLGKVGMTVVHKDAIRDWERKIYEMEENGDLSADEVERYLSVCKQAFLGSALITKGERR